MFLYGVNAYDELNESDKVLFDSLNFYVINDVFGTNSHGTVIETVASVKQTFTCTKFANVKAIESEASSGAEVQNNEKCICKATLSNKNAES